MKKKLLVAALLALPLVLGMVSSVRAEGYSYAIDSVVTIKENLAADVDTTIKATAGSGASVPASITVPRYGYNLLSLKAKTSGGQELTIEESDAGLVIRLNQLQGRNSDDWAVTVSYSSTPGVGIGASSVIMLPPFDYGDLKVASEKITIISAADLGPFVTRGTEPTQSTTSSGSFVNIWQNKNGPIETAVGVLYGDRSLANLTYAQTLSNDSYWWQTQTIVLPPDTNQQQIFIDEVTPRPSNVRLDVDGNVLLDYRLRPRQSVDVSISIKAAINSYTYSLGSSLLVNDIDTKLVERYTELNDTWKDTDITTEDVESTPAAELVEQIYDAVAEQYAETNAANPFEASKLRANALIGELRATKIPARLVIGAAFGDGSRTFTEPQAHAWVEVNLPDVGWVTLDPTFEQKGDYFGVADVQRIAFALRGFDPDYPPESLESFSISFSDEEPPVVPEMKPTIAARKHMILPGLTLDSVTVTMPGGVIVDNTGVVIGGDAVSSLGSLAPYQSVTLRSASVLAAAFTSESVQFGTLSGGVLNEADVTVQTTMTVNYLPMIILLGGSVLVFLIAKFIVPKLHGRKSKKDSKKSKSEKSKGMKIAEDNAGDDIENVDMLEALNVPDDDSNYEDEPQDTTSEDEIDEEIADEPEPRPEPRPIPVTAPKSDMSAEARDNGEPTKLQPHPPKPKPKGTITLEKAQESTPEDIRRELQRRKKPRLIQ